MPQCRLTDLYHNKGRDPVCRGGPLPTGKPDLKELFMHENCNISIRLACDRQCDKLYAPLVRAFFPDLLEGPEHEQAPKFIVDLTTNDTTSTTIDL